MSNTRLRRTATVVASAAVGAASWAVATQLAGVRLGVQFPPADPSTVGVAATAGAAVAATTLGWALLALLETRVLRPRRSWIGTALAVVMASLAFPLAFATGASALLGLVTIHLAVATVAITGLARTAAPSQLPSSPAASGRRMPGGLASRSGVAGNAGHAYSRLSTRLSPPAKLAIVGAGVAVVAGISAAGTIRPPVALRGAADHAVAARLAASHPDASPLAGAPGSGPWPWSTAGAWGGARSASWSGAGAPRAWAAPGTSGWPGHGSKTTEYFDVASTRQPGPGAIILTGALNEGGVEHPGRAIDHANFANGTFRIDHSTGRPTVHFDRSTCVGTITQVGPFDVIDATGPFEALQGHPGTYYFDVTYTTAKSAEGCTNTTTSYIETIHGAMTLDVSGAHRLSAGA